MSDRRAIGAWCLAAAIAVGLLARPWWEVRPGEGALVEVVGAVPAPALYRLEDASLAGAIIAAGGDARGLPDVPVATGDRVIVGPNGVRVVPSPDSLRVGRTIDVDTADFAGLTAIPGVGEATARRILDDRDRNGPFGSADALVRVPGLTRTAISRIAAFAPMRGGQPVDVNRASAAELDRLPGIGSVLARRIVDDRAAHGRYSGLDDLRRVAGVRASTVDALRSRAVVL